MRALRSRSIYPRLDTAPLLFPNTQLKPTLHPPLLSLSPLPARMSFASRGLLREMERPPAFTE